MNVEVDFVVVLAPSNNVVCGQSQKYSFLMHKTSVNCTHSWLKESDNYCNNRTFTFMSYEKLS